MIRTGPAEYSKRMMELIKLTGFKVANGGYLYRYKSHGEWERMPCYTEKDFYKAVGMKFIEPMFRI